jgi:RpiR family carbohydrate utilization transcriptional regulator
MENLTYLERIREVYPRLKGVEKKIAEYIMQNPERIIKLSITELSEECQSGEATIFRVCKKLGYKGYQELKIKIASEVIEPIKDIHEEINENDSALVIMEKVIRSSMYSLEKTMKLNKSSQIEKSVSFLLKAETIAFFGMGGSAALAFDGYHKFLRTGKRCEYNSDSHLQVMTAGLLKKNDCIIAISNTGSNKELIDNISVAKENGVNIIAITSNNKSPISKVSDEVLLSYGQERSFKSEASESKISTLAIIDTLFVNVCLKNKEKYMETVGKIREAIAKKRF